MVELLGEGNDLRDEFGAGGDETWRASAGMRGAFGARSGAWAKAHSSDRSVDGTRDWAGFGTLVRPDDRWGVGGAVEVGDNVDTFALGMRASF